VVILQAPPEDQTLIPLTAPVTFDCCLTCYRAVPTIATTLLPTG